MTSQRESAYSDNCHCRERDYGFVYIENDKSELVVLSIECNIFLHSIN